MGNYGSRIDSKQEEPEQSTIKCHYEILGVEVSATADDLKKAYRQQALIHHPDKNPHRQEEAAKYFTLVQKAYEVLSDPQERSWYDRNRDAILGKARQKSRQQKNGNAPTIDDLMAFFNSSAYTDFDDSPKGFYTVYRRLFEQIEAFENEYEDDIDEEFDPYLHTSFGQKSTRYEPTLVRFYEKWLNFTSNRPFFEIETYQTEYADNRRMRRAMEKENEKKREGLRREFSETVRSLAAFVRKRDPRWKSFQAERQAEKSKAESIRKETVKISRKADIENFVEPEWAKKDIDDLQSAAKEFFQEDYLSSQDSQEQDEQTDSDAEYEEDYDEIYCDPCKKLFKTKLQWKNHEQSKKHKDTLRKMGIRVNKRIETDSEDSESNEGISIPVDPESESFDDQPIFTEPLSSDDQPEEDKLSEIDSDIALEELLQRLELEGQGRKASKAKSSPSETAVPQTKTKKKPKQSNSNTNSEEILKCTVCHAQFTSRNQLFKHINTEGHALAPKSSKKKR